MDQPVEAIPPSDLILYQTEDGQTRIQCRFKDENLWLTQAQMAELFQTTPQNITQHIKAIYEEAELAEDSTCKQFLQVRSEGLGKSSARSLITAYRSFWPWASACAASAARSSASGRMNA